MRFEISSSLVAAVVALSLIASTAYAQDHEKCYKISDPAKIKGVVDLVTPQFGLEAGCKLGSAKYFCAPASKTVISATSAGVPIVPLPVYAAPAPGDRICYQVKCPVPPPPFPPDQNVTDQFGNRTLKKFKASYVCTPAVVGPGYCGNGIIDPGEDCDGLATGACPGTCQPDCTCTCPTACCYVESLAAAPDTQCFEYTGTPAQVAAFQTSCTGVGPAVGVPGSTPLGSMANSTLGFGPCVVGPIFGMACIPGPPFVGNLHVLPADSTCP